jgi:hypothetical protein
MIRFVIKEAKQFGDGEAHHRYYTIDAIVPDLERTLRLGGSGGHTGDASYEFHTLVAAEVRPDSEANLLGRDLVQSTIKSLINSCSESAWNDAVREVLYSIDRLPNEGSAKA